jgi:cob(I)alamin adenosyltransferase
MKIYTKKGDNGTTQLIGGTRVPKFDARIEAYGTVDELNAYLGLLRDLIEKNPFTSQIIEIQDRLFTIGSLLAEDKAESNMKLPTINEQNVIDLENFIDAMDEELPEMKNFILPGGHPTVSHIHIARCVCRRTERKIDLLNHENPVEPIILHYINRLSDYLFVLSRKISQDLQINETTWKPRY